MRRHLVFILAALLSFYSGLSYADNPARPAAQKSTAQKSTAPKRGILYRVDYRGNTCYLFGTVHVGQAAFYPLEPQVTRAMSTAGKLVIEVDISDSAALKQAAIRYSIYPDGQTIDQHISADSLAKLKAALQTAGIPYDNVARLKPWVVATLLIVQEMARIGYPTEQGIEAYFVSIAKQKNIRVQELESAGYQFSLFDTMSARQQEEYLRENLAELANGTSAEKGLHLIAAWQNADSKAMEAILADMQNENTTTSTFLQSVLLDQRNPNMANKIEELIKSDKRSFVAVGALHLLGSEGVPELLRQRGYQIQKLY